jgi:OmcA/MtrC family decaheme c-type cytochrome
VWLFFLISSCLLSASDNRFTRHEKAFYADPAVIAFVRPGLVVQIQSAAIATDGTISTVFTLADPQGLPLDRTGVTTPGPVSLSFVAATIPKGQEQYTAYTTRQATGPVLGTVTQAAADSGGTFTSMASGQYRYTFNTKAPSGFDATATHTIGIFGSRNLTEFDLGTSFVSTTLNFVPNGSAVVTVRDVVREASCDACHDQIAHHGGARRGVAICVLCHTPQTLDPDTGNTTDFNVMIHKIHMGSQLPSVIAGHPFQLIGFGGTVFDWSTVVYPADPRRCTTCHDQKSGAAQAAAYATRPTRAACGSCHDDVNFQTGKNHVGGPAFNDNQCATCHNPVGELEFDASVIGAHIVPIESASLSGIVAKIISVQNGFAGKNPVVTFSVRDNKGNPIPLPTLNNVSLNLAGPTTDFGYTSFGPGVTTPGYVQEAARDAARCGSDGNCTYTFQNAIPAKATGTYSIEIAARRTEVILPGTTTQRSVQYGAINMVYDFAVDGGQVQPRRTIVTTDKCNQCHAFLAFHGQNRNAVVGCVFCHNPSQTDSARRATAQDPNERTKPPQAINFTLMIHRIHYGQNLVAAGRSYTVLRFNGGSNDFTRVRYSAMSPQGTPGDTRNCELCHVNGSEQNLPTGLNQVQDPQGPINPVQPVTSACTACHVTTPAASHALANTTSLGESCVICHGANSTFSVGAVHAQF